MLGSVKMYKSRVSLWRLDKKNKECDMKAIVRKRSERLNVGEASQCRVRGRAIGLEEVVRYWGRKGISIEDIAAQRSASATPVDVEVFTPVISRVATPLSDTMTTPVVYAIPEQVLTLIQNYVKGSFESGTWVGTNPRNPCFSIKDRERTPTNAGTNSDSYVLREHAIAYMDMVEDSCSLACDLLQEGFFNEAGANVIHANAAIKQIVLAQDPHTIIRLCRLCRDCVSAGRHEIAKATLRQFRGMGIICLGKDNPLPEICHWFARQDQQNLLPTLETCTRMIADTFTNLLGPLHRSTLDVSVEISDIIGLYDKPQARRRLELLLEECQNKLDPCDYRIAEMRTVLMDDSMITGDKADTERRAWELLTFTDKITDAHVSTWYRVFGLRALAYSQYATGLTQSAILSLNEALELHGSYDSWARKWLLSLEKWHSEQGNDSAAAQVRITRLAALETEKAAGLMRNFNGSA